MSKMAKTEMAERILDEVVLRLRVGREQRVGAQA
jgi:hypothetical protein